MSWEQAINVGDFERLALEAMAAPESGYFNGGANDERTLRENVAAYGRRWLRPRVLVEGASAATTATTVLGTPVSMPLLVAPTGFNALVHPGAEPAAARAAAAAGTIFTLSTLATTRPSELAAAAPDALRWFQLYLFRDRAITRALADEALDSGFSAVALTVDLPRPGRRERDLRTGFTVPADVDVPAVSAALGRRGALSPHELIALTDMAITWADVAELAAELPVPLVLKGIQTAEDAVLAHEHGAAAVIVSNHGGRQLDGVAATIDILPEVVDAVGDRMEVLVDGGVRRGSDVLVALALGARAVLVGRPPLWGLAVGGEAGATRVLELLRDEIELGLALIGAPSPQAVTRAHVR